MGILPDTLTREDAIALCHARLEKAPKVVYLTCLDVDAVFRLGKVGGSTTIEIIRYHEDDRPMYRTTRSGEIVRKQEEILTYQENGKLYVLAKSGGVSLFDGLSQKLKLARNRCWYFMPRETPIPPGIVIAKNVAPDHDGNTHYALQPAEDMLMEELKRRLGLLIPYMRPL